MLTALAGELKLDDIGVVNAANPDVVGVRGAACDGGRGGWVNAHRSGLYGERMAPVRDPFRVPLFPADAMDGETRDPGAISAVGKGLSHSKLNA